MLKMNSSYIRISFYGNKISVTELFLGLLLTHLNKLLTGLERVAFFLVVLAIFSNFCDDYRTPGPENKTFKLVST